jgi:hypothetical protein
MRDIVLTRDEIRGLMADLLVSAGPPTAATRFSDGYGATQTFSGCATPPRSPAANADGSLLSLRGKVVCPEIFMTRLRSVAVRLPFHRPSPFSGDGLQLIPAEFSGCANLSAAWAASLLSGFHVVCSSL